LLVDAAAQHGREAVDALRQEFLKEWSYAENERHWPTDVRRTVVLALARAGAERQWALDELNKIETTMLKPQDVSGRMDECLKQADAWIALGEPASARSSFKQFLKASFGIGYRKDYQLDEWMEWLERANDAVPSEIPSRICWFARAAVSLEESTEGKAANYAAQTLLKIAFRWSPRRSIGLLRWFASKRVVWYEEALESLLLSALTPDSPPLGLLLDFVADAFVPITTSSHADLVERLVVSFARSEGQEEAVNAARRLLHAIQTWALPSKRPKWRRGLALALQKMGVDPQVAGFDVRELVPDADEQRSSNWLRLKDGSTLSTSEVEAKVNSVAALERLMESEVENCHFDWEPVVAHMVQMLTPDQMQSALDLLRNRRPSARGLSALAQRFRILGDRHGAWRVGEEALRASERYGWDRRYAGTRLTAFRALVDVDAGRARPLIYSQLANDLTVNFALAGNIALNLPELLSLLVDPVPIDALWPSVERYIHRLFETSALPEDEPAELHQTPLGDTTAHALTDLLLAHLDHSVNALADSAKRCLRNGLLRGDRHIIDAAREALKGGEGLQEALVMVLQGLTSTNPGVIKALEEAILNLRTARNHAVRRAADLIAKGIGAAPLRKEARPTELPPANQLAFPDRHDGSLLESPGGLAPALLVDSTDPLELVRPFEPIFELVAHEAGLPLHKLLYRASRIMRELAPQTSWSPEAEKTLRRELESGSLRLTFRKPRAIVARRALFHVVGELVDSGRLTIGNLRRLDPALRFYDPAMLLCDPISRPSEFPPIGGRDKSGGKSETWLDGVSAAAVCAIQTMADGRAVLAEETRLTHLDWDRATESRASSVRWVSPDSKGDSEELFGSSFNTLVREYSRFGKKGIEKFAIIRHDAYFYESPGVHWLALNPYVGRHCGWKFPEAGRFRWTNDKDEIMVESLWWVDGLVDQSPPHFDDELGEGWLVVASPAALSAIEAAFGATKRRVKVTRSYVVNGHTHTKSTWA